MSDPAGKDRRAVLETLLVAALDQARICLDDLKSLGLDGVMASSDALERLNGWGREGGAPSFPELSRRVAACTHCGFPGSTRGRLLHPPPGKVRVIFVDEMPDRAALREGSAMGGEAGALLWKIIAAMKLGPDAVYVTHARMCRSAPGQAMQPFAALPCRAYLEDCIRLLRPEVVCALGEKAGQLLSGLGEPLRDIRGRFHTFFSLPLMVTHHPEDLLLHPGRKRETWEDVRKIMEALGLA